MDKRRTNDPGRRRRPAASRTPARKSGSPPRRTAPSPERSNVPEVVYTPAKPFNRNRLLLRLATVLTVVLALVFGLSIFFKVKTVNVSGIEKYDAWTIREASGIREGDGLLSFGKARAASRILEELPYVESVRIGIKLPDTVNIEITEHDVFYSIKDSADNWWLITAGGKVLEKTDSATAGENTQILGIRLESPSSGKQAVAQEPDPTATNEEGETVPVTVLGSERLEAALKILVLLEEKGILGQIVSVDVSDLGNIVMWYGQNIQVKLGNTDRLAEKIQATADTVGQLKSYDKGVLDVSFTITPDQPRFDSTED